MDEPDAFSADNFPVFVTTHPPVTDVPSIYGTPILEYPGLLKVRSLYLHVKYILFTCYVYMQSILFPCYVYMQSILFICKMFCILVAHMFCY